jgi:hypothetical protein
VDNSEIGSRVILATFQDPAVCHCIGGQTIAKSAFRREHDAPAEHFVLKKWNTRKLGYIKMTESGNNRRQTFCGTG